MTVTQVVFKIDPQLKRKALLKAKHEGITYSAFLKSATKAFVAGDLALGIVHPPEIFNKKTALIIDEIERDVAKGKNLSPVYDDAGSFMASLNAEISRKKK